MVATNHRWNHQANHWTNNAIFRLTISYRINQRWIISCTNKTHWYMVSFYLTHYTKGDYKSNLLSYRRCDCWHTYQGPSKQQSQAFCQVTWTAYDLRGSVGTFWWLKIMEYCMHGTCMTRREWNQWTQTIASWHIWLVLKAIYRASKYFLSYYYMEYSHMLMHTPLQRLVTTK